MDPTPFLQSLVNGAGLSGQNFGQVQQGALNRQQAQQEIAMNDLRLHRLRQDDSERERFQTAWADYLHDPRPEKIIDLAAQFPSQAKSLTDVCKLKDTAVKQADLGWMSSIYSAAENGRRDLVVSQLKNRISAERGAGKDVSELEDVLRDISDDPDGSQETLRTVRALIEPHMWAADPEAFRTKLAGVDTTKKYIVGRAIGGYDAQGRFVSDYRDPESFTLGKDQERWSSGGVTRGATGGFDGFYSDWLAPTEGGYAARDGKSGHPVNFGINQGANPDIDVRNLTPERAKQIMRDRYWVPSGADAIEDPALQAIHADTAVNMGVDTAKRFLEESKGNPTAYMALRAKRYRDIGGPDLPAWQRRNRDLAGYAGISGAGQRVAANTTPTQSSSRMAPEEVASEGLDPNQVWYRQTNGIPVAVKGGKAKAVGGDGAYSQSALDAFDRAIETANRLKTHPGLEAGVGAPAFSINPLRLFGATDGNIAGWIVPGSKAADFRAELGAMKAQVFLPMVQSMKGMGALSNAEGDKLNAAIGALDTSQSEGQFKASLDRIVADLTTYKNRGMGAKGGQGSPNAAQGAVRVRTIQQATQLPAGTIYIAPDGKMRRR